jgi:hypothetical protein
VRCASRVAMGAKGVEAIRGASVKLNDSTAEHRPTHLEEPCGNLNSALNL